MGSMATHISAFLLLFPVGVRRLLTAYSHHLRPILSPHCYYVAKPWYFASSEPPPPAAGRRQHQHDHHNQYYQNQRLLLLLKDLDFYALLVALPIAAFSELFLFLTVAQPLQRLPFSHQSAAVALFWILLLAVSLRHCLLQGSSASFPDDVAFALAALAFLLELFLTGGWDGREPIEGRIYGLLSLLTLACAAACMVLAANRSAFAADVALSVALAFKATWVLQAGWSLFGVPPKGCHRGGGGGGLAGGTAVAGLVCQLDEDRLRGVALVDLLFAVHAVGIASGSMVLLWAVAKRANRAAAAAGGDSDPSSSAMMRPMIPPELEMDR